MPLPRAPPGQHQWGGGADRAGGAHQQHWSAESRTHFMIKCPLFYFPGMGEEHFWTSGADQAEEGRLGTQNIPKR